MAKEKEKQTTSEEEVLDLDTVMKEGMEKFDEELKTASEDISTDTDDTKKASGPAKTDEDTEHPEKKKPDEEITSPPKEKKKDEEPPAKKEEEKPKEEQLTPEQEKAAEEEKKKKDFRFTSHEEAEKGYTHVQGEKTRLEQEMKKLQSELDTLKTAQAREEKLAEIDQKVEEYAVERHKESLTEIDALDPDDKEYQDKVAIIWAKKDRDIRKFEREHSTDLPVPEPAKKEEKEEDPEKDALKLVKTTAKDNEIDPDDPLFMAFCSQAPIENEDGTHIPFKEQIEWAVQKTKNYLARHEKRYQDQQKEDAEKASKEHQKKEMPLGRSATDIEVEKKEDKLKPVSLDDAIESAANERRL